MNIEEYKNMATREEHYWWHIGRNQLVLRQLQQLAAQKGNRELKILNIGCGTGGTIPVLQQFGFVDNVDTEPMAAQFVKRRGYGDVTLVDGVELPFHDESYDLVVALDVLEHIDSEVHALQEWWRVLKPCGNALLTVPAHSWLWSEHDEALHHFRRYSKSQLDVAMHLAHFEVLKKSYAISFSFPLVVAYRLLANFRKHKKAIAKATYVDVPESINWLFTKILDIESRMLTRMDLPIGTSVLAIGSKQG